MTDATTQDSIWTRRRIIQGAGAGMGLAARRPWRLLAAILHPGQFQLVIGAGFSRQYPVR